MATTARLSTSRSGSRCRHVLFGVALPTVNSMGSRSLPLPVYFSALLKVLSLDQSA